MKTPFATKSDITRIIRVVASKQEVQDVLAEVRALTKLTRQSINNNDGLAKRITDMESEQTALSAQIDRHEEFIKNLTT